jgi:hypothetical protein
MLLLDPHKYPALANISLVGSKAEYLANNHPTHAATRHGNNPR